MQTRRYSANILIFFALFLIQASLAKPLAAAAGSGRPTANQVLQPAPESPLTALPPQLPLRYSLLKETPLMAAAQDGASAPGITATGAPLASDENKSYLIPALEVPVFLALLNIYDRTIYPNKTKDGKHTYDTNLSTFWDHLTEQDWHFDKDRFDVNQFGHPYEGATMYGLARSCGLNFWQSLIYSNVGSFLWEMGGETSRPSVNDMITTGNAGSLLGEALYRMANLVLEDGGSKPDLWHELGAAVLSPPVGFNRFVFGDRFKGVYPNHNPAFFWRLSAGGSYDAHFTEPNPSTYHDGDAVAEAWVAYGLPGKGGYDYRRPFDYFDFRLAIRARSEHVMDNLSVRGLLIGTDYEVGDDYRGIWGLYGTYDYLAPYLYRASSTALQVGTTGQYRLAPGVALQGSLMGGLGYGAAGTDTTFLDERGYHYGATPQGLLSLYFLFGDRVMLALDGKAYFVSDVASDHEIGSDFIFRGQAGVTVRVVDRHAVSLRYVEAVRDTNYHSVPDRHFSEGTISLVYTFLSDTNFGAVHWR